MAISETEREVLLSRISRPAQGRHFKILLYGIPGSGKTVLSTELGESNFMIMSETGDSVLTKSEHKHLYDKTERVPFVSFKGVRGYAEMLRDGTLPHTHLIIDNASGIQDKKLSENMEDPRIKNNDKIGRIHPDLSTQQDYQILTHQMRPVMVDLMSLENHDVTLICHMRPADPDRNEFQARPDLTKAIYNLVNEKVDVVAYVYKGRNGERLVKTDGDNRFVAKSRITPETEMTIPQFIAAINAWRNS